MKKVNVLIVAVLISLMSWAQSFEQIMTEKVHLLEQKTEKVNLVKLADDFGAISKKYKKEESAKYYQSLCLVFAVFEEKDAKQKDAILSQAEKLIDKGISQYVENAEWYILKALMYQAAIMVNPTERGYLYSQNAEVCLVEANKLEKENPRYYFLKGQNVYFTPEQYGGGKAKAKPLFEKAAILFEKENTTSALDVKWGRDTNAKQLEACK
jgi:hypothetical protein